MEGANNQQGGGWIFETRQLLQAGWVVAAANFRPLTSEAQKECPFSLRTIAHLQLCQSS